jgi:hypothetical protein
MNILIIGETRSDENISATNHLRVLNETSMKVLPG